MFSRPEEPEERISEPMKNFEPSAITELMHDCRHHENCYIICTLCGALTDFGKVSCESVCFAPYALTFEADTGIVSLTGIQWEKLKKMGDQYDLNIDEGYGLNIAFYL